MYNPASDETATGSRRMDRSHQYGHGGDEPGRLAIRRRGHYQLGRNPSTTATGTPVVLNPSQVAVFSIPILPTRTRFVPNGLCRLAHWSSGFRGAASPTIRRAGRRSPATAEQCRHTNGRRQLRRFNPMANGTRRSEHLPEESVARQQRRRQLGPLRCRHGQGRRRPLAQTFSTSESVRPAGSILPATTTRMRSVDAADFVRGAKLVQHQRPTAAARHRLA